MLHLETTTQRCSLIYMLFETRKTRQETADLVTFTEDILNEKLHFLCSVPLDCCQSMIARFPHF